MRAAVLLACVIIFIRNSWMGDDGFIDARVVDNFVHGFGLRWNVDERVQVFTSPLWTLLLTIPYFFTGEFYYTTLVLSYVLSVFTIFLLLTRFGSGTRQLLLILGLGSVAKSFVDYSVCGLENPLSFLLLTLFWITYLNGSGSTAPVVKLCFIASLAITTRIDNVFYVAPILAMAFWQNRRDALLYARCVIAFCPLIAWELFSLVYYGFFFPNTYYAKVHTGIPTSETWQQGLKYLIDFVGRDPGGFFLYAIGLAFGFRHRRNPACGIAVGIVCHTVYVLSVGGDFMTGRFFSASILGGAVIILISSVTQSVRVASAVILCLLLFGLSNPNSPILTSSDYHKPGWNGAGIADERGYYFPQNGVIALSGLMLNPSRQMTPKRVVVDNMIGLAGYLGGPQSHLVDRMALSDPLLARIPALFTSQWRIGHFERALPPGYLESLMQGGNHLADRALASYYDKLVIITRGPLLSFERLKTIVAMNLGQYDSLVDTQRYRYGAAILPHERVATKRDDHTAWDAPGIHPLTGEGVRIAFSSLVKASQIDIGADCNDSYDVIFIKQKHEVGKFLSSAAQACPGIVGRTHTLPSSVQRNGFDTVYIRPHSGDGRYALGHVIPIS